MAQRASDTEGERTAGALEARVRHLEQLLFETEAMFEEHLDMALARAVRSGSSVAVLFRDLDGFKDINDTMGHGAGDELLYVVAERLREATRATDLVARLGGDEFLVLLADLPDEPGPSADEVLRVVSDRIAESVARPIELRDRQVLTTISIGAAM